MALRRGPGLTALDRTRAARVRGAAAKRLPTPTWGLRRAAAAPSTTAQRCACGFAGAIQEEGRGGGRDQGAGDEGADGALQGQPGGVCAQAQGRHPAQPGVQAREPRPLGCCGWHRACFQSTLPCKQHVPVVLLGLGGRRALCRRCPPAGPSSTACAPPPASTRSPPTRAPGTRCWVWEVGWLGLLAGAAGRSLLVQGCSCCCRSRSLGWQGTLSRGWLRAPTAVLSMRCA
jgi:hypothetical protein